MQQEIPDLSTEQVLQILHDDHVKLIDIRPVDAYNGWQFYDEKRGGHIAGAKSLPKKWSQYMDWLEIVRSKMIVPENHLVLYGYREDNIQQLAQLFIDSGYPNVSIYSKFICEWTTNDDCPMEHLERFTQLVPPRWVKSVTEKKEPSLHPGKHPIICHVHYRNYEDYLEGHIHGAIPVDIYLLESPDTWNLRSPYEIRHSLLKLGIHHDRTVILYGRFSSPKSYDPFPESHAGQLGAIRCAFILMYAGVKDVRILNGGIQTWQDDGYQITSRASSPVLIQEFGCEIPANPNLVVDTDAAKESISSSEANLISVRSWKEYIGEVTGYKFIQRKGRIKGSIFGNCGSDAYHMENYRNVDHTTREFHEIENLWNVVGVFKTKRNIFYCGTGWRGSEAFFNAFLMGWDDIAVYDGGWLEWSSDPKNPFEIGGLTRNEKFSYVYSR